MVSTKSTGISVVALIGLLQMCPAPFAAIGPIVGAAVTGAVSGAVNAAVNRREVAAAFMGKRDLPPGISQESIDQCVDQINGQFNDAGITVSVHRTNDNAAQADNVPPACMNLATVLTGDPAQTGGPLPVVLGTSSLQYQNLNEEQFQELQSALDGSA